MPLDPPEARSKLSTPARLNLGRSSDRSATGTVRVLAAQLSVLCIVLLGECCFLLLVQLSFDKSSGYNEVVSLFVSNNMEAASHEDSHCCDLAGQASFQL